MKARLGCMVVLVVILVACSRPIPATLLSLTPTSTDLFHITTASATMPLTTPQFTTSQAPWPTRRLSFTRTPTPSLPPRPTFVPVTPSVPLVLDQSRPSTLTENVSFLGIVPDPLVREVAWSPDGTMLTYTYLQTEGDQQEWVTVILQPVQGTIVARLFPGGVVDLAWSPDGQQLAFLIYPWSDEWENEERLGLFRLGESGGREIPVASKSYRLQWLDDTTIINWTSVGTGAANPAALDLNTGEWTSLENQWANPPDDDVLTIDWRFSSDRHWFVATEHGMGLPRSVVGQWDHREEMTPLAAGLDTRWTSPQFWDGHSLAFLSYPPGLDWRNVPNAPATDLYLKGMDSDELNLIARGVSGASLDPSGRYIAALLIGKPELGTDGRVSAQAGEPHIALLDWPQGQLRGSYPVNADGAWYVKPSWPPVQPWSLDGSRFAFLPARGGLAWMDREGRVKTVLTEGQVEWAGWGAGATLAILIDQRLWLIQAQNP